MPIGKSTSWRRRSAGAEEIGSLRRQIKSVKMAESIIPRKLLKKLPRNTILVLAQSNAQPTSSNPIRQ